MHSSIRASETVLFYFGKAMLMRYDELIHLLIGAEGAKTPVGVRFRGDPAGAGAEEARRNAHGKRSAWSGNQQINLTER
jgi:hypothetical protein